ncbi:MAG: GTP cyclohydrolase I FolE [SAR324 cluster bacterium]|nr:GTP cyclohydrolase I FolE [Desulfobacterales bacterium]MDP6744937.1 GTP cyclohydrolase I FolE [SAR324 cluster bacterium]MDP7501211.1 GTP cyclohydrolase I FolE [SAR324 cluster bacterium]|tara:strand:+ start:823 stop:1434 length:612 start_codon:yes stop_codon:yes gene_type:complete
MKENVLKANKITSISEAHGLVKQRKIENAVKDIMDALGLDLSDDSLCETPKRVAKMYVNEIFAGLNEDISSKLKSFDNSYGYKGMVLEKDIPFYSMCEHHLLPIIGRAHVAYIPSGRVLGLSKLNRIVHHFAKRPQVQERLTVQIADLLSKTLVTDNVAVVLEARHMCVEMRGVKDSGAETKTMELRGKFNNKMKNTLFQQLC